MVLLLALSDMARGKLSMELLGGKRKRWALHI
jgi:hypothetical protein